MSDDEREDVEIPAEPVSKAQAKEAGDMNKVTDDGDVEVAMSQTDLASAMKALETSEADIAAARAKYI